MTEESKAIENDLHRLTANHGHKYVLRDVTFAELPRSPVMAKAMKPDEWY